MGIKALKLTAVERYVSDLDPGKNAIEISPETKDAEAVFEHGKDATVWLLGTLDSILMSFLSDDLASMAEGGGLVLRNADNDLLAVRLGLKGWENFSDDDGQPILFETETISLRGRRVEALRQDLVEAIPIPVLRELGRKIKASNSLSAVQAKNSVSASSLSTSSPSETAAPAP